jgi:hypothetical protein
MFANLLKNGPNKKRPLKIEKKTVKVSADLPSNKREPARANSQQSETPKPRPTAISKPLKRKVAKPTTESLAPRKASTPRRSHSAQPAIDFGNDDSGSEDNDDQTPKKMRFDEQEVVDTTRELRLKEMFESDQSITCKIIHGSEIATLDKSAKFVPLFEGLPDDLEIELQYPSLAQKERYA